MKRLLTLFILAGMLLISREGLAITTMTVQFEDSFRMLALDMTRKEVIETLGAPDIVKSDGACFQYVFLGMSIFFNINDEVEQIYLAPSFQGTLGSRSRFRGIRLGDIEREFGVPLLTERLNYQPSQLIQNRATVETESATDPMGVPREMFPLTYSGNRKLYVLLSQGRAMKYKYVLDEEGIAFWLDHNQRLYATVLYTSRPRVTAAKLPALTREPVVAAVEKKKEAPKRLPIVHFDFDKHNIKKVYVPDLTEHVAFLQANPQLALTVEGHTDSFGTVAYNQRLSERRANAVRQFLIARGIVPGRISTVGKSELEPIADNKTPAGRALNRRAEFLVAPE